MTILPELLGRAGNRDGNAIGHRPCVRVVAVLAAPHAPCGPRDDAHPGTVHCGPCREGMKESQVARFERNSHIRLGNVPAETYPKLERARGLERRAHDSVDFSHSAATFSP